MSDTETILQLKLTLADSVPEVWRRVQVPSDFTLGDVHYVIDPTYLDIGLINMLMGLIFPAEEQALGLGAADDVNNEARSSVKALLR